MVKEYKLKKKEVSRDTDVYEEERKQKPRERKKTVLEIHNTPLGRCGKVFNFRNVRTKTKNRVAPEFDVSIQDQVKRFSRGELKIPRIDDHFDKNPILGELNAARRRSGNVMSVIEEARAIVESEKVREFRKKRLEKRKAQPEYIAKRPELLEKKEIEPKAKSDSEAD